MYPKEFFIEQFSGLSNDDLLVKFSAQELAENARIAIVDILAERGVSGESMELMSKESHKAEIRKSKGTIECDFCGNSAKVNPVFDGGQRFCSRRCLHAIRVSEAAVDLSSVDIMAKARSMRDGACPQCGDNGAVVEIRYFHRVTSFVYFTRYTKKSRLCCVSCGRRANIRALGLTMLFGWFGIPFGVFLTPIYCIANLGEMFERAAASEPSDDLVREAKYQLASAAQRSDVEMPRLANQGSVV